MSYHDLRRALEGLTVDAHDAVFGFLGRLSSFVSLAEDDGGLNQARELCIRVLDRMEAFAGYEEIVQALLRNVGLFPYLDPRHTDVATQLATEAHRPESMPAGIVFTAKQAEVYRELLAGRNVVLSAPTSFGKSLIIDALIASGRHRNIVIVVPTLALVDETRRRLMNFSPVYKIITHLSQTPAERNIFVHTQERAVENPHIQHVDFFVIDEFYKLQIDPKNDGDARGVLLNQAFYRMAKQARQFYMLGPNIDEIPDGFGQNFRCTFIQTDFSTVVSETHLVPEGDSDESRLQQLLPALEGPTLVFSGSVNGVRRMSRAIVAVPRAFTPSPTLQAAIHWLGENFHPGWGLVDYLKAGIGMHHGKLPRSVAQLLVRLFDEKHIDFLACTSTLIEGVNSVARNVIITDNKINNRKYDFFTFNNIKGRSGRMWKHFVGHVYLFHTPPQRELEFVDVPAFTQGVDTPESLLVQMDEADLSPVSEERLEPIWSQRFLSLDTIRQNMGFDPKQQIAVAKYLAENLHALHPQLNWRGPPQYEQLKASFDLAWEFFKLRPSNGVRSASQLTFKIWRYAEAPNFRQQIAAAVGSRQGTQADEALEEFLEFTRQWVSFRAPRVLTALERIQQEVFGRYGLQAGNYRYYCSRLESLFLNPVVVALDEYGVPIQLAERVVRALGEPLTLDDALLALAAHSVDDFQGLSGFEKDLLRPLCVEGQPSVNFAFDL